ncbi:hypothetical protein E2C01_042211 [Portunus trituberculatus]|uniref:Uncharacterized protein n=1 Tax=Portunus trituberculatus TaxID=210409 RepID=A0A5B7FU58_PORTR|nr:hypothetical protein [Portunus trituberculatus]
MWVGEDKEGNGLGQVWAKYGPLKEFMRPDNGSQFEGASFRCRRGTVEPCVLWGPRGLQAHGFVSCPRSECRLGFLTRSKGFLGEHRGSYRKPPDLRVAVSVWNIAYTTSIYNS